MLDLLAGGGNLDGILDVLWVEVIEFEIRQTHYSGVVKRTECTVRACINILAHFTEDIKQIPNGE